ncbi:unnamed protein product [Parnassius apollo]|uniref:tRNA:m(4)X modification enzyme TRM13 n=1 Tax=Parnassius apollo TaxID=110799 RepID=A0A8S3YDC4_PARAO|nr:unnamed protein product [Parnassius apollo]
MASQCQFYVIRKKRLCRMTVRPGKQFCGEHEPHPNPMTDDGQLRDDTRIPCPNDPKHTCYVSKLQKHLLICNARQREEPEYIVRNVNISPMIDVSSRRPLNEYAPYDIQKVIDKVNLLYNDHVEGNIETVPEKPIHQTVLEDFSTPGRTESSLRHLRQASSILYLIEITGLVHDKTCYVELGAGKGQLSFYASNAWCNETNGSCVLLIDRASLRHKRDNKLRSQPGVARRLRADLAHLALDKAPGVLQCENVVGLAKHLCGVATDYALRSVVGDSCSKTVGVVMATCCHHRCEINAYVGELQELGISSDEFNIMLGIVSWATCGDGRSRERRKNDTQLDPQANENNTYLFSSKKHQGEVTEYDISDEATDYLKVAVNTDAEQENNQKVHNLCDENKREVFGPKTKVDEKDREHKSEININLKKTNVEDISKKGVNLDQKSKELVGRRAKALLDWGRVLFLRKHGFIAHLCYFVPPDVSLENVCIVATKCA